MVGRALHRDGYGRWRPAAVVCIEHGRNLVLIEEGVKIFSLKAYSVRSSDGKVRPPQAQ